MRLLIIVPQFEQQLTLLDLVALLDPEVFDAPADDGQQLGAQAGFHGTGPGVGQSRFDLAGYNLPECDRDWLWPAEPGEGQAEYGNNGDDDGDTAHEFSLLEAGDPGQTMPVFSLIRACIVDWHFIGRVLS